MTSLTALDAKAHKHLRVDLNKVEEMGADLHMSPVVVSEFNKLIVHYPILFSKHIDTGQFSCVCLMGLQEGENLFWQQGRFNAIYIPLMISRHPFFVGKDDTGEHDYVICLNSDCHSLSETQGEPLFNEDGSAAPLLNSAKQQLAELLVGEQQTGTFIELLVQLDLLVPLSLDITFASGEKQTVKGLYSIDEDKLQSLPIEQLQRLRDGQCLHAAYTQLASLGQIYHLIEMKNKRAATTTPWTQH